MVDHSKAPSENHLDKAIEQTFPASDPVAGKNTTGTEQPASDPTRKTPKTSPADVARAAIATETCPCCNGTGKVVAEPAPAN